MRVAKALRSFVKTTGKVTVLSTLTMAVGPAFGQTPASARMVLLQCLADVETPGRAADQRCSRQAAALCLEGTPDATPDAVRECQTTLACGFLADGRVLARRSGNRGERPGMFLRDWSKVSQRCAQFGAEAEDCRRLNAREWWVSARSGARAAGVETVTDVTDVTDVALCSLE